MEHPLKEKLISLSHQSVHDASDATVLEKEWCEWDSNFSFKGCSMQRLSYQEEPKDLHVYETIFLCNWWKLQVNEEESIVNLTTIFNAGIEMLTAKGLLL